MIEYEINGEVEIEDLREFLRGRESRPPNKAIEGLLEGSDLVATARENGKLVGFLTAISDGAMYGLISLLEVLPSYRDKGVGAYLVKMALMELGGLYEIVFAADPETGRAFQGLGFEEAYTMRIRNHSYGGTS